MMAAHYGLPLLSYDMWRQAARPISTKFSEWSRGSIVRGKSSTLQIKTLPSSEMLVIQLQGYKAIHPIIRLPSWSTSWEHQESYFDNHQTFFLFSCHFLSLVPSILLSILFTNTCTHTDTWLSSCHVTDQVLNYTKAEFTAFVDNL